MRLRNVKGSKEFIDASPYVVHEPEAYKGIWREKLFNNRNPLHIEIGMGKGQFIHQLAEKNPDINYIGIEMYSSVLYRALERREQTELNNLFFIRFDAKYLLDIFDQEEVDRIYLNFSDPWPKDRHAKRRLPSRQFLARYDQILDKNGTIEFKTDNRGLFDFALEEIEPAGWRLLMHTFDLHADTELMKDNIMTEYEEKFASRGNPICKMIIDRERR